MRWPVFPVPTLSSSLGSTAVDPLMSAFSFLPLNSDHLNQPPPSSTAELASAPQDPGQTSAFPLSQLLWSQSHWFLSSALLTPYSYTCTLILMVHYLLSSISVSTTRLWVPREQGAHLSHLMSSLGPGPHQICINVECRRKTVKTSPRERLL